MHKRDRVFGCTSEARAYTSWAFSKWLVYSSTMLETSYLQPCWNSLEYELDHPQEDHDFNIEIWRYSLVPSILNGMAGNCTQRIWITCTHGIVWYWGAGLGTRGFRGGTGVWNLHILTGESVIFLKYFCLNRSPKSFFVFFFIFFPHIFFSCF